MIWTDKNTINNSLEENDHIHIVTNFCRNQQSSVESSATQSILRDYIDGDFSLEKSLNGRPYIVPKPGCTPIFFSVSHSKDVLAVAVSLDEAIGVDIEALRPRSKINLIQARYFGDALAACSSRSFYHHWCAREAYIKATDGRLFRDLSAIKTQEKKHYLIGKESFSHRVIFFEPDEHYIGAVCQQVNSTKGLLIRRFFSSNH